MNPFDQNPFPYKEVDQDPNFVNLVGLFSTGTDAPSLAPRKISEQFVVVTAGGSSRAYIYNTISRTWMSVVIA